jgi:hypothetical protein
MAYPAEQPQAWRKELRGVTHFQMRLRGHMSAADERLRANTMLNRQVSEKEAAAHAAAVHARSPPPDQGAAPQAWLALLISPAGFRLAAATELLAG